MPKIKKNILLNRTKHFKNLRGKSCCIVHIDINIFSFLSFKYSFSITNKILEVVSERIITFIHDNEFVENIYADDFILFLKSDEKDCEKRIEELKKILEEKIKISDDLEIKLYYRISVIHYPDDIDDLNKALDCLIMFSKYIKSKEIEGIFYFNKTATSFFSKIKTFVDFIYNANYEKYIVPALQGIHDLNTHNTVGCEILTRIAFKRDIYSAYQFFDLLTYFKMNLKTDEVIMKKALLYKIESSDNRIYFFNIVPEFFYQYMEMVTNLLEELKPKGLNTNEICIELTEISELSQFDDINKTLKEMKNKYGVLFAIDDFGAGYSNLNVFTSLEIDFLKIDKEFIEKVINDPVNGYLLRSIVELSLFRNIAVIGEGIDCLEKLRLIKKLGFDYAQGFYFSKPEIPKKFIQNQAQSKY